MENDFRVEVTSDDDDNEKNEILNYGEMAGPPGKCICWEMASYKKKWIMIMAIIWLVFSSTALILSIYVAAVTFMTSSIILLLSNVVIIMLGITFLCLSIFYDWTMIL